MAARTQSAEGASGVRQLAADCRGSCLVVVAERGHGRVNRGAAEEELPSQRVRGGKRRGGRRWRCGNGGGGGGGFGPSEYDLAHGRDLHCDKCDLSESGANCMADDMMDRRTVRETASEGGLGKTPLDDTAPVPTRILRVPTRAEKTVRRDVGPRFHASEPNSRVGPEFCNRPKNSDIGGCYKNSEV